MFTRPAQGFTAGRVASAVERALRVASEAGFDAASGEIVSEGANILVRVDPASVLVRTSHWIDLLRFEGALPWYEHEVAVTTYLNSVGFSAPRAVTEPVLEDDGVAVSIWEWIEHDPKPAVSDREIGTSFVALHRALAECPVELPPLRDQFTEIHDLLPFVKDSVRHAVPAFERKADEAAALLHTLDDSRAQVLHGDAHYENVVGVEDGLMWLDFEDTCRGPLEYDLATMVRTARRWGDRDERELLAGYGDDFDAELVETLVAARDLQAAVWNAVLLTEMDTPSARGRIDRWLATYAS